MARTAPVSRTIAALGGTVDEVLSNVQVPAFVVDSNAVIAWMNKRAMEVVGDLRGQQFAAAVMPASLQTARLAFARKILGSVKSTDHEVAIRSASGDPVRAQASSVAIQGDDNRVVGVFGLLHIDDMRVPMRPVRHPHLTPRQQEILGHLAQGCSTDQIAAGLGIGRETVRNHVRGILRALGVHSRLEAVAAARRSGLLLN
jgi:DNA-binding CsgD family transcriptional regulator